MRVAIDCRYVRARPSGVGAYTEALIEHVPRMAPHARFDLWRSPERDGRLSRATNVREVVVGAEPNHLPTVLWPRALADLRDADVLHLPYNIGGLGVRCPTVVTIHDLMWLETPRWAEPRLWQRAYQAPFYRVGIEVALRRAHRIVAISQATADRIAAHSPAAAKRTRVIPHGVAPRFRPGADPARAARILDHEGPYVLAMGQNAPYKNHAAVVAAFEAAGLPDDVRLVLVQRIRHAPKSGPKVIVKQALSADDALVLLQSCSALVQFSLNEGFGMPALEAMACGRPVIVSDIPPLREVVADAGVRVPLEGRALGATMRRVLDDAVWREELGARGVERAAKFSWGTSAERHLELYREAAG